MTKRVSLEGPSTPDRPSIGPSIASSLEEEQMGGGGASGWAAFTMAAEIAG
jgi:hypothetical protein